MVIVLRDCVCNGRVSGRGSRQDPIDDAFEDTSVRDPDGLSNRVDPPYTLGQFHIYTKTVLNDGIHGIVLIFTYVAPEKSPFYSTENDDGIVSLNEKILTIKYVYPEAEIFLAGDLLKV